MRLRIEPVAIAGTEFRRRRIAGVLDNVALRRALGSEKDTSSNLKSDTAGVGHACSCEHGGPLGCAVPIGWTSVRAQLVEYLNEGFVRLRAEQEIALADDMRGDGVDPQ